MLKNSCAHLLKITMENGNLIGRDRKINEIQVECNELITFAHNSSLHHIFYVVFVHFLQLLVNDGLQCFNGEKKHLVFACTSEMKNESWMTNIGISYSWLFRNCVREEKRKIHWSLHVLFLSFFNFCLLLNEACVLMEMDAVLWLMILVCLWMVIKYFLLAISRLK